MVIGIIILFTIILATLTLIQAGQNKQAITLTLPLSLAYAIITQLVTTKTTYSALNFNYTSFNNPILASNIIALLFPLIFTLFFTLIFGINKYNQAFIVAIYKGNNYNMAKEVYINLKTIPSKRFHFANKDALEQRKLLYASKIIKIITIILTLALLVLWLMPIYSPSYIFSKKFFIRQVVISIIQLISLLCIIDIFPIFKGRKDLWFIVKSIYLNVSKKQHPNKFYSAKAIFVEGKQVGIDASPTATIGSEKETREVSEKSQVR